MAQELGTKPQEKKLTDWDDKLVNRVVAEHQKTLPSLPSRRLTTELRQRLAFIRRSRSARMLNHWPAFAPTYLRQWSSRLKRRRASEITAYLRMNRSRAIRLLEAMLTDPYAREKVFNDTALELARGVVTERYFFLALKRNARDYMDGLQVEREWFVSLEQLRNSRGLSGGENGLGERTEFDVPSNRPCDQDPLEVLIQREEQPQKWGALGAAKKKARKERKCRWIKQKQWAQSLEISPKSGTEMSLSTD